MAKEGTTVGEVPILPAEDNDAKLYFYDVQGESVFTNPPDTHQPTVDHGLDEDQLWAFSATLYNQSAIKNQYSKGLISASRRLHQPFWGQKLTTTAFYKPEKYKLFLE